MRPRRVDGSYLPVEPATRFWEKVRPCVQSGDECWEWDGATAGDGYGSFWVDGRTVPAHRFAWELEHGAIPDGLFVCHHCDNPRCVRHHHLFLGTFQDNMDDMNAKGRNNGGGPLGEANGFAKLTAAQIPEIRRRYAAGESGPDLAREFGISQGTISLVALRKRWGHVPEEAK